MNDATDVSADLCRLMTWLSPSFPVGAYSYSHGLEYAVEAGLLTDMVGLSDWVETILLRGSGRVDGLLLCAAHRCAACHDMDRLIQVSDLAAACRGSAELALESSAQGKAFAGAAVVGWPGTLMEDLMARLDALGLDLAHPVAVGAMGGVQGIGVELVVSAYLHAFAANLISAGIRLIPLGQSDGVRALAALEPAVQRAAHDALAGTIDDVGTATPVVDWASARHETQYTRLFRS